MNCTLCNTLLQTKIDQAYYRCDTCSAYIKDLQFYYTTEDEKKHYEHHNNDVNDVGYQKFTAPLTNAIVAYCTSDMLGLDYGCGKGPVITHLLEKQGYQVKLFDPYFYPDVSYLQHTYDYIFSCEVFEHFYNPLQELEKLSAILKKGGLLFVKTHLYTEQTEFSNWYYRKDETHVFIYTYSTFKYIAKQFGYSIDTLTERLIILRKL